MEGVDHLGGLGQDYRVDSGVGGRHVEGTEADALFPCPGLFFEPSRHVDVVAAREDVNDLVVLDIDATTTTERPQRQPGTETGDGDGDDALSDRDFVMAQALGAGHSQTSAAELVGLSAKTLKRRLDDPAFAAAVASARRSFLDQILGKLSQAGVEATDTLVELLNSGRPADRLRAAVAVLSHAARYSRQLAEQDIATRLDRLEALLLEQDQPAAGRRTSEGRA